jgi:hypothetical protein
VKPLCASTWTPFSHPALNPSMTDLTTENKEVPGAEETHV